MKRQRAWLVFGLLLIGTGMASIGNAVYWMVSETYIPLFIMSLLVGLLCICAGLITVSSTPK